MDSHINVLYQCDNNYAPFMGVSLTSLLMNNVELENLHIFLLGKDLSIENMQKIQRTCDEYGRKIIFLDCAGLDERIENYGMNKYRGSYATFYKLFVSELLKDMGITVQRMLYIDSDTVITGNIKELYFADLRQKPIGMVPDTLAYQYKEELGFEGSDIYYNAGLVLYDFEQIYKNKWEHKMSEHIRDIKADYHKHEQDLLNVVFRNNICTLPLRYNLQSIHRAATVEQFYSIYKKITYYTKEELKEETESGVILHFLRFNGEFPWMKNSTHPYAEIYDMYKLKSLWKDEQKLEKDKNLLYVIERILYKILPRTVFLFIFKFLHDMTHIV
ncbi:MAG: glycosyltransferase family 8 protein [Lachnospiraceae bacterium]|nr:glycosyltransferase family 8 protein [Lachnospiraceae bacterium]